VTIALLILGGLLLVIPGLARSSLRLAPRDRSRVTFVCLILGAAALEVGLVLSAVPTLLEAVDQDALAEACSQVVDGLSPGGPVVGWTAAVLAGLSSTRLVGSVVRRRRQARAATVEPWLGRHTDRGDFELVILPSDRIVAVGVPGERPQVVISDGLMAELTEDEVEAVIRHEAAHHRLGHARFLKFACALDDTLGRFPLVRRSINALRSALEQWADDVAVAEVPDRAKELRRALLGVAHAKGTVEPLASTGTMVLERANRIGPGPRQRSRFVTACAYAPMVVAGFTVLALVAGWLTQTHHALAFADYCPA
jgi:hypothetical protein